MLQVGSPEEGRPQAKFESQNLKKTVKRSEGVAAPSSHRGAVHLEASDLLASSQWKEESQPGR